MDSRDNLVHDAVHLVLQLSVIIVVAWISDLVGEKLRLPRVVSYIIAGIVIGPFLLGSIPIPHLFPDGLFLPRSLDGTGGSGLHHIASIAALLLLFHSGLETDVTLFVRFAVKGTSIGLGGLLFSFAGGYYLSFFFFPDLGMMHPAHLFMGTIATATSVSITTSILSMRKKMSSPEGVTVLSAAVLDDVLGVIILAVVTGIAGAPHGTESTLSAASISVIAGRALVIWIGCTAVGILFARKFGHGLKKTIKNQTHLSIFVLGLAFLLGGLFETMGLSMIIGAYIVGLTLSNTDLSYVIQEKISPLLVLFVPTFFIISGMDINIFDLVRPRVLLFGLGYSLVCALSKFLGGGIPALLTGFTPMGAARIGSGMMPRGEVALIMGSIGLTSGSLSGDFYGAIMMMIVFNSTISPLILSALLAHPAIGVKNPTESNIKKTVVEFRHLHLTRFIVSDFLSLMEDEGFFVSKLGSRKSSIYHIRRDTTFLSLHHLGDHGTLIFHSEKKDIPLFKTALYEAVNDIAESAQVIKSRIQPSRFVSSNSTEEEEKALESATSRFSLEAYMSPFLVRMHLRGNTKEEIIKEMTEPLEIGGFLHDRDIFVRDVLEREKIFSTGLQNGIAMPHAKSSACKEMKIVIGLKPEGIDFSSLDSQPSTMFVLIASPTDTPHLSVLTQLSTFLNSHKFRTQLLACSNERDVVRLFTHP